jgi:hypothetical protein
MNIVFEKLQVYRKLYAFTFTATAHCTAAKKHDDNDDMVGPH